MVSMTTAICERPKIGRSTVRSIVHPSAAMAATAPAQAIPKGSPAWLSLPKASAVNAPSIMRSPWAKFTCSVAL